MGASFGGPQPPFGQGGGGTGFLQRCHGLERSGGSVVFHSPIRSAHPCVRSVRQRGGRLRITTASAHRAPRPMRRPGLGPGWPVGRGGPGSGAGRGNLTPPAGPPSGSAVRPGGRRGQPRAGRPELVEKTPRGFGGLREVRPKPINLSHFGPGNGDRSPHPPPCGMELEAKRGPAVGRKLH